MGEVENMMMGLMMVLMWIEIGGPSAMTVYVGMLRFEKPLIYDSLTCSCWALCEKKHSELAFGSQLHHVCPNMK